MAVAVTKVGDEILLSSARGQATRFRQSAARDGRDSSGVRGIKLRDGDYLVGMVVADPDATLLTACANGYGKRTPFGPNAPAEEAAEDEATTDVEETAVETAEEGDEADSSARYPTKGRGTMGVAATSDHRTMANRRHRQRPR